MGMRLTRSFEKHELYPNNAGLTLTGKKGACRVRIEQRGMTGGARYEVRVGGHVDAEGEVASTKAAERIVRKIVKGC